MSEAAFWWVNTVTVETYLGSGTFGDVYADPVSVECWVEDVVKLVNDAQGAQVVSSSTVHGPLAAAPASPPVAGQFATGSKVTVQSGRVARVIQCGVFDSGSLDIELDHVEVALT